MQRRLSVGVEGRLDEAAPVVVGAALSSSAAAALLRQAQLRRWRRRSGCTT